MDTLKDIIRSRTREGWRNFAFEKLTDLRIWIQEHGEKAAILTFAIGLFIALFFKLFVFLVVVAIILCYIVWFVAK